MNHQKDDSESCPPQTDQPQDSSADGRQSRDARWRDARPREARPLDPRPHDEGPQRDAQRLACLPDGCGSESRRSFLQSAGCLAVTAAFIGLSSEDGRALPLAFMEGAQNGNERRYPIPAADSVSIDRSAQLIMARVENHVYVFALSCPHQNNAVKWVAKDHHFQCTKHDSQYRADGVHTAGRATRNMDRYVIRRDADMVVVDLHRWVQSDKDPAGWAAANLEV